MSKPVFPHVRIVVDLGGPDGNAFAVMGRVAAAMRDAGIDQSEIDDYLKRAMASDFDTLLRVSIEMPGSRHR